MNHKLHIPKVLLFKFFEIEVAVYNQESGALHLLPLLGADLLKAIQQDLEMHVLVDKVLSYHSFNIENASDKDIQDAEMIVKQFIDNYQTLGLLD